MKTELSNADKIRQILAAATEPLTVQQIFERDDSFETVTTVASQMSKFIDRGEFIRAEGAGRGKATYTPNPHHIKAKVGTASHSPAATPKAKTTKPAKAKAPKQLPLPVIPLAPYPEGDDATEDPAKFCIYDNGMLVIDIGEGDAICLAGDQIARLENFINSSRDLWEARA